MHILLVDSDNKHHLPEPATAAVLDAVQHAGQERGVELAVDAVSVGACFDHVDSDVDGILLAPRVRHLMPTVRAKAETLPPVARITARQFSAADGPAILSTVLALVDHDGAQDK